MPTGATLAADSFGLWCNSINHILRNESMFRYLLSIIVLISTCFISSFAPVHGSITTRVKDITYVQGVRDNFLFGYGLVIGLSGSGDKSTFDLTIQLTKNIFEKLGVIISADDFISKNIAAISRFIILTSLFDYRYNTFQIFYSAKRIFFRRSLYYQTM